ncbi:MFS transporter [Sphaerisporangium corydalis]|uniref:MFS transporter n=1 Tax=Sphaerisporangium corydalis TaxID=1441875 RepID=A0ABV9EM52_9ACTN|nr:MFS transporter [Sphaerisporangium corydalis]
MQANLPLRLARSAVFTVVCLTLASVAHWFAGGAAPSAAVMTAGGLVVMTGTALLAGRERSPVTVTGLLLAAQAVLHLLLGPADLPGGPPHGPVPGGPPQEHALSVSAGMLVAHLTAALLTAWWLSRGESALWSVLRAAGAYALRRVRWLLALLWRDEPPAPAVPFRRAAPAFSPARDQVLRHAVVRRGPPVPAVS